MQVQSPQNADRIYCELESRIRGGEWAVGDVLPREIELAAHYNCGRHSVSQAIARLAHEGLVERRKRAGTRVLRHVQESAKSSVQLDAFAFIYPSKRHEGILRMLNGFQDAACSADRRVIALATGADYKKEAEIILSLSEFDVKGAVIHPVFLSVDDQLSFSKLLIESKFPIVLADLNLPGVGCPTVLSDGFHASYTMTRYLLQKGLRNIGFLANNCLNHSVRDKFLGYRHAMDEVGTGESTTNVVLRREMTPRFQDPLKEPTEISLEFLSEHKGLEGVVCVNDFFAHGCLIAAKQLGIRIPRDLKVVGINDFQLLPTCKPSLTTYHVPFEDIGQKAFQALSDLVTVGAPSQLEIFVRGQLVARNSA